AEALPGDADLSVVAIPDPQVTYYLPIPVRYHDPASLAERLSSVSGSVDGDPVYVVGPQLILEPLGCWGEVRVLDRAGAVHPRKGEQDRMIAVEIRPDPRRLAEVVVIGQPTTMHR